MPRIPTSPLRRRSFYSSDRPSTATLRKHARFPSNRLTTAQRLSALQRRIRGKSSSTASSHTSRNHNNDENSGWGTDLDNLGDDASDTLGGDDGYIGGGRRSLAERTSLIVERVGDVKVPQLMVNDVVLAGYGGRWAMDLISFLNNSVRREICDLWVILGSLQARVLEINQGELREFFAWFSGFEAFVVRILKSEEEVLYPFVETRKRRGGVNGYGVGTGLDIERLEGDLCTANRMTAKGTIIRMIRDASASAAGLHGFVRPRKADRNLSVGFVRREGERQSADVLREVIDLAKEFVARIEKYFRAEEQVLPGIIEQKYAEFEVRQEGIMRQLARSVWRTCRKDESTIMMTRWMECRADVRLWCSHVLRRYERVAMPIWKKKFDNGRGRLVRDFASRRAGYEMELESAKKRRSIDLTRRKLAATAGDPEHIFPSPPSEMMSRISSRETDVSRVTLRSEVSRTTDISRITEMSKGIDINKVKLGAKQSYRKRNGKRV